MRLNDHGREAEAFPFFSPLPKVKSCFASVVPTADATLGFDDVDGMNDVMLRLEGYSMEAMTI